MPKKIYDKITNRLPEYVNPKDHSEILPEKEYKKILKYQQKNYYKFLCTGNYQKIAFSNLKKGSPVPFDFPKYQEDWMGCIPINVLPLYARNGADGIDLNGEEIETKTLTINETYWCIGPRGGIRTKSDHGGSMGSYYNIGFGTNHGNFDSEIKKRHTYTIIISKLLGRIVSIYYLEPEKVVELLNSYDGGHPKIHLSNIQKFGTEYKKGLPIYGWKRYQTYLKKHLPKFEDIK